MSYRLKTATGLTGELTEAQLVHLVASEQITTNHVCTPDDGQSWMKVSQVAAVIATTDDVRLLSEGVAVAEPPTAQDSSESASETSMKSSADTLAEDVTDKRKLRQIPSGKTPGPQSTAAPEITAGNTAKPKVETENAEAMPSSSARTRLNRQLTSILGKSLADGRYVVTSQFGAGSMAYVFQAADKRLETDVIIKIPKPEKITTEDFRERFERESQLLVRLSHPHVVKVLDVGEYEEFPYVVMQMLSGGTLLDRIERAKGRMPPSAVKGWVRDVARALDFCFKRGMVHRDVKPANILFDDDGNAYVSDFGLTKIMHGEHTELCSSGTADGIVLGTPNYLAPELILGSKYDGRADQYALGLTVYHALCGKPPMQGKSATATIVNQTQRKLDLLSDVRPDVPREFALAVAKSIEKNPQNRFTTSEEFAEAAVEGLRDSSSSSAFMEMAEESSSSSRVRRRTRSGNRSSSSSKSTRRSSASRTNRPARKRSSSSSRQATIRPAADQGSGDNWLDDSALPPARGRSSRSKTGKKKKAAANSSKEASEEKLFGLQLSKRSKSMLAAILILATFVFSFVLINFFTGPSARDELERRINRGKIQESRQNDD